MLPCSYEPHRRFSRIDGRAAGGFAALVAFPLHTGWGAPTSDLDLGVGGRQFVGGGRRGGRSPLHQCASLGAPVPGIGSERVDGSHPLGTPARLRCRSHTEILKVATAHPEDLGLGFTTWSLPKLEEYLRQQPGLKHLARSTIRRRLHHAGLRYRAGQTWCLSTDPDFEVKKNQVVSLYCNPPQDGIVVCMDELGPLQTIPRGGHS